MKTERLYYDDPYLLAFDAKVVETVSPAGRFGLVLDRTAFYPTSGGQPNDLGAINGIPLLDCFEDEKSGKVVHILAAPMLDAEVHGQIDSVRRLDHMQQHSGQHILSQAFVELFGWPTLSFHLGTAASTIDLGTESITREQTARAEELANRVVQENRNVAVRYFDDQSVVEAGLRKPSDKSGEIRVIDVAGYDRSACGGTHVRMTGEIGIILITRLERAKKQSRVEFLCGNRALRYAQEANRSLEAISQIVSVPPLEAASGVRTAWEKLEEARRRVQELELKLIDYEAAALPVENGKVIAAFEGRGIEVLKLLAGRICERPSRTAILTDVSGQLRIVIARSPDSTVDAAAILKTVLERFGGRGGGRPNLAQGGGLVAANASEVLEFASQLISV